MKGQFGFMFEMNMEFELIQVDFYGLFGFFIHFMASTQFEIDKQLCMVK